MMAQALEQVRTMINLEIVVVLSFQFIIVFKGQPTNQRKQKCTTPSNIKIIIILLIRKPFLSVFWYNHNREVHQDYDVPCQPGSTGSEQQRPCSGDRPRSKELAQ